MLGTMHDTQDERVPAGRDFTLDDRHPMVPFLLAKTLPTAVIILPLELLHGRSPAGSPHIRLAAPRSSLHPADRSRQTHCHKPNAGL